MGYCELKIALEELTEAHNKLADAYAKHLDGIGGGTGGGGGANLGTLPSLTILQLSTYNGADINLLKLSDGGLKELAFYDIYDTTSIPSEDIIVDAKGRRYHRETVYSWISKMHNAWSAYTQG